MRLRPKMSPNRPAVTTSAAITSRYAFMTHWIDAGVASRSCLMSGRASVTTVESSISRKSPLQAPARVHQARFSSVGRTARPP